MFSRCLDYEKDFDNTCEVYDCRVKDFFGEKFYIVHNTNLDIIRFVARNKTYNKERKYMDSRKLSHVIIPKWLEVIDVTEETYNNIQVIFPGSKLPYKGKLNMW